MYFEMKYQLPWLEDLTPRVNTLDIVDLKYMGGHNDLLVTIAFLITPPIFFALVRQRVRAVIYSVVALWLLLIAGSQYHLAYTPGYESIAPGLTWAVGWFPSVAYTLIWLGVLALTGLMRPNKTT